MIADNTRIYHPNELYTLLNDAHIDEWITNNKGISYANAPCAFDIETTSFYRDAQGHTFGYDELQTRLANNPRMSYEKLATMYVWQLGLNGLVMIGRTWDEFQSVMTRLSRLLGLDDKKRLRIYVHNLSYEFQFIQRRFNWVRVFSLDLRNPIEAVTDKGIDFRCSYILSGYSLNMLGKQLVRYPVQKLVGDLDYTLLRHSETPLTDTEIDYCVNDVRVVMSFIQETIEKDGDITQIPLTKTGYCRKHCRKACLGGDGIRRKNYAYVDLMEECQIRDLDEFRLLHRAYMGGFTHANAIHARETLENVASYDFTSDYPYVMCVYKYPMSHGEVVELESDEELEYCLTHFHCVFDVMLENVRPRIHQDHAISASKCYILENGYLDNGRVVTADRLALAVTELDYEIIRDYYVYDSEQIRNFTIYQSDYLPIEFVSAILELYKAKTVLKGIEGKETEYLVSKELLNSCYGMCVTNPIRDEYTYENGEWAIVRNTEDTAWTKLGRYNRSKSRFLYYPWGVYVTAYARYNLLKSIIAVGQDYVYSDTDSIKVLNRDMHSSYFDDYNVDVLERIAKICDERGLDSNSFSPQNAKGERKTMGVWEYEGTYEYFKTLGAKRYMVSTPRALMVGDEEYNVSLTVSGLNKHVAIPYLIDTYGSEVFNMFDNALEIPPKATGKLLHTYIDRDTCGTLTDYLGNTAEWAEKGSVHLEPTGYALSMSAQYADYISRNKRET